MALCGSLSPLQHKEGVNPVEWDDRPTTRDFSSAEGASVADPEPQVTDVAGTAKDLALKVFAIADNPKFECDVKPILFRPTMMFQVGASH
jgi:hydrocephalus-inducing protein